MPKIKLTKSAIDALQPSSRDEVYWDSGLPGFGVKVTPKGRKVFIALYRVRGGQSRLRKYTIGPYGKLTLHHARATAQRVFAERFDGRDPAAEKLEQRRREVADRVDDLVEAFAADHLSGIRSGKSVVRALRREVVAVWGHRSIHDIKRRDISSLIFEVAAQRTPNSAHRLLKGIKRFFTWCLGRAIIESSPATGIQSGYREVSRDRVLSDEELASVIKAARVIGGPFGGIVEFLALTGQRREEVNQMIWDEVDLDARIWTLPATRVKNRRRHIVHLSHQAIAVLMKRDRGRTLIFSNTSKPYQRFNRSKRRLDALSGIQDLVLHDLRRTCVSGMARLGVAPHVADKILNHQSGTISGVAAVYQRHEFLIERKDALERWGTHVAAILNAPVERRKSLPTSDESSFLTHSGSSPTHLIRRCEDDD
jgi:integrase